MASGTLTPRPCERQCKGPCGEWKHYSRFRSYERTDRRRNSTVSPITGFSPICRACEQKTRNEKKNADRPKAIIEQRAKSAAGKANTKFEFFWTEMNYRSLVPYLRAMMMPEGLCQGCGHPFLNERDIQIEHLEPPRFENDWARLNARNLRLFCASCNGTKAKKSFSEWLDEQEDRRLSNRSGSNVESKMKSEACHQFSLFEF